MSRHYELTKLYEVAEGDENFLREVAKTFLEEIGLDLISLEEAIRNENRELAYQFAHKMKPNIEMFGVNLKREIVKIESWSKSLKRTSVIFPHLNTVKKTLNLVFDELKEDFQL